MGHAEKVAWLIYHWEQRPPTGAETDEIIHQTILINGAKIIPKPLDILDKV